MMPPIKIDAVTKLQRVATSTPTIRPKIKFFINQSLFEEKLVLLKRKEQRSAIFHAIQIPISLNPNNSVTVLFQSHFTGYANKMDNRNAAIIIPIIYATAVDIVFIFGYLGLNFYECQSPIIHQWFIFIPTHILSMKIGK